MENNEISEIRNAAAKVDLDECLKILGMTQAQFEADENLDLKQLRTMVSSLLETNAIAREAGIHSNEEDEAARTI